jgi:hypothetical protein
MEFLTREIIREFGSDAIFGLMAGRMLTDMFPAICSATPPKDSEPASDPAQSPTRSPK